MCGSGLVSEVLEIIFSSGRVYGNSVFYVNIILLIDLLVLSGYICPYNLVNYMDEYFLSFICPPWTVILQ